MKKILSILLIFCAFLSKAQNDYTGNIVHVINNLTVADPRGKLFIVDSNEDSLYLPAPSAVSGKVIAIIANPYTAFVRLNQNVTYRWNNTTGFSVQNFLYKQTSTAYLYSNGTDYEYYYSSYLPAAVATLVAALNTTAVQVSLPYKAIAADFGKTFNLSGGSEFLNLPNPASIGTPAKSFKIVNQGKRLLTLNYPFTVDGQGTTTRKTITHSEGGNMWELIAEGGIYRAISNH